jgi:3-oxoacyl-[acyl-carrier protein] reductase
MIGLVKNDLGREVDAMDLGLRGKVALVSGGSEGIGYAAARRLALEGARVAIAARRPDVLESAAATIRRDSRGEVLAVSADIARADDVHRFVESAA